MQDNNSLNKGAWQPALQKCDNYGGDTCELEDPDHLLDIFRLARVPKQLSDAMSIRIAHAIVLTLRGAPTTTVPLLIATEELKFPPDCT